MNTNPSPVHRKRRSARLALKLPIRVFATDFKGIDFVEDSTTLVVNLHGARIALDHQLLPDQEVRILSHRTGLEDVFRVVNNMAPGEGKWTYWGVEALHPGRNIWGARFPRLQSRDQKSVRVMLQCPECHVRELLQLDEPLLLSLHEHGGLTRGCLACGKTGVWRQVLYYDS